MCPFQALEKGAEWVGGFRISAARGDGATGARPAGFCARGPQHLSRQHCRWEWSHAFSWLGIEFHFQPLLGGSHGSLQTFDNEAKYTLELEEAWAAAAQARGCGAAGSAGHPRPGSGDSGAKPRCSAGLLSKTRPHTAPKTT